MPGFGVQGGDLGVDQYGEPNLGAGMARVDDENLTVKHSKRGTVTMVNDGPNSNGSEFLITFGATNWLDGYNNVVGEVVSGQAVLDQLEADCNREGALAANWVISEVGQN